MDTNYISGCNRITVAHSNVLKYSCNVYSMYVLSSHYFTVILIRRMSVYFVLYRTVPVYVCECLPTLKRTYPFRLLIWEDAALSTCCEVAVNLEGVSRAALVWINPVFTWRGEELTYMYIFHFAVCLISYKLEKVSNLHLKI